MAWEWVTPAGTAVLGTTSLALTFIAYRASERRADRAAERERRHEIEDTQRRERKETYLRFLDSVKTLEASAKAVRVEARARGDVDAARDLVIDAYHSLSRMIAEVEMVAGSDVVTLAYEVCTDADRVVVAALAEPPAFELVDGGKSSALLRAMRDELALRVA